MMSLKIKRILTTEALGHRDETSGFWLALSLSGSVVKDKVIQDRIAPFFCAGYYD